MQWSISANRLMDAAVEQNQPSITAVFTTYQTTCALL
jgi:hypothetical protein